MNKTTINTRELPVDLLNKQSAKMGTYMVMMQKILDNVKQDKFSTMLTAPKKTVSLESQNQNRQIFIDELNRVTDMRITKEITSVLGVKMPRDISLRTFIGGFETTDTKGIPTEFGIGRTENVVIPKFK